MLLVEITDADGKKQKVTTRVGYNRVEVQKRRPDGSTYSGYRSVRISRRTGEEI
jgi:large subunit ribosomal protein L24